MQNHRATHIIKARKVKQDYLVSREVIHKISNNRFVFCRLAKHDFLSPGDNQDKYSKHELG